MDVFLFAEKLCGNVGLSIGEITETVRGFEQSDFEPRPDFAATDHEYLIRASIEKLDIALENQFSRISHLSPAVSSTLLFS